MPRRPRRNRWTERHGLTRGRCALYSGNLGFKQDPRLLIDLAAAMGEADPRDRLVVVSEGMGADWLAGRQAALGLANLVLLPFQPYGEVPDMMASADVLLAIVEHQDRPLLRPFQGPVLLLRGPRHRALGGCRESREPYPAAQPVRRVVEAGDSRAFTRAVLELLADDDGRTAGGENARRYAEDAFDVERITARFEAVLEETIRGRPSADAARP